jgi:hypothetical protein
MRSYRLDGPERMKRAKRGTYNGEDALRQGWIAGIAGNTATATMPTVRSVVPKPREVRPEPKRSIQEIGSIGTLPRTGDPIQDEAIIRTYEND